MSVTLQTLDGNAGDAARWDAFVAATPEATFFHRAGWKTVIERAFGQSCHFLYAERDGAVVGVLPLAHVRSTIFGTRLVAGAWGVAGYPVAADAEALKVLEDGAEALLAETRAEYIEYRDPPAPHDDWHRRDNLYATFDRLIPDDEDATLKDIPRKQRAVVRKALKSGLEARVDDDLGAFYALFSRSMRDLGTPVFSRRYFETLKETFGDAVDVVTVYDGGTALASVLNYYHRDRVMPFYTGAAPAARRSGAADLMYFRTMRLARETREARVFDFGRSKVGTGPFAFKKNWGFEPRPLVHTFRMRRGGPMPDVNPNNPKFKLMVEAWKRLPLPVANTVGPWIGRQVG